MSTLVIKLEIPDDAESRTAAAYVLGVLQSYAAFFGEEKKKGVRTPKGAAAFHLANVLELARAQLDKSPTG